MKKFGTVLTLMLLVTASVSAQVVVEPPEDDPFANDPFFTKPIKDWFSAEEIRERARRRSERVIRERSVDDGDRDITGIGTTDGINDLNKMYPMLRFNRVEAIYLGIHADEFLQWEKDTDLKPYGSIGYSFGRDTWLYTVGVERYIGLSRNFKLGFSHHKITDTEDKWRTGWTENSITSFFAGYDFMDYFARNGTQIYSVIRHGSNLEYTISFTDDAYTSLDRNTRYSMFGKKSNYRENPLIEEGNIRMMSAGIQFNPQNRALSPNLALSGEFYSEFAEDGFGTDFAFRRLQTEWRSTVRLDQTAVLKSRLRLGTISGTAPDFKEFALGGISTLRARSFKYMRGEHMALLNHELFLGRKVGQSNYSGWVNEVTDLDNLRLLLFVDMGWVNPQRFVAGTTDVVKTDFADFNISDVAMDVGVGLNFSTFRVDLAWPSTQLSRSPSVWIRFNQSF